MVSSTQPRSHDAPVRHTCLSRVPVFSQLGASQTTELSRIIRPAHYQKGETVQLAGDIHGRLLVLNRGRAKVSRTSPDGREQVLRILNPGDFTGELAVFTGEPAGSDIIALEPSSFCTIDGDSLTQLIATHPRLALTFVGELSRRLEATEKQVESTSLQSAEQRIAATLIDMSAGQSEFNLPVSKKDLAAQVGVSPETLSRKLRHWEQRGLVSLRGQRGIAITKPGALELIAR